MPNLYSLDLEASSSQYTYKNDTASLSITGNITIEAWINLEQLASTIGHVMIIAGKYDWGLNKRSYYFGIDNTNDKVLFVYSHDGTNITGSNCDTALGAPDVGSWVHLAVAVDVSAKTFDFYKNGVLQTDTLYASSSTSIYDGDVPFSVGVVYGSSAPDSSYFDGKINNLRVWNDIRTAEEISSNWKKVLTSGSNLVSSWYADNNHNDLTSSANNLTAVNTPVFSTDVPFIETKGGSLFYSQL